MRGRVIRGAHTEYICFFEERTIVVSIEKNVTAVDVSIVVREMSDRND